jgi:putative ABC transport system permease protein
MKKMFRQLPLAARMLWRDLSAGELTLLALSLIIAVAAMTSVGFFTARVEAALGREANQMLGGDAVLSSDAPLPATYAAQARALGLTVNESLSLTSMAAALSGTQLVGVKAVAPGYPLRGQVRIAPGVNQADAATQTVPAPGQAWVDERLATALQLRVGESINLGQVQLKVAGVITYEPDRGVNFFAIVPRLMINAADIPATGLIQPGSRVRYRLHLAGSPQAIERFQAWATPRLSRGESLEDVASARPEVRNALDRARQFLKLCAMLSVVLAAVAIGLSARRFMERHLNGCAVMRCMGASSAALLGIFTFEFILVALASALIGAAMGFGVQALLSAWLGALADTELPPAPLEPLLQGVAVALVLMLGFMAPYLVRLSRVPSLSVLRREWGDTRGLTALTWGGGAGVLAALMLWVAGEVKLGALVVAAFAGALALFALLAWGLLRGCALLRHRAPVAVRLGLSSLRAKLGLSVIQVVALAMGLMAVFALSATRADLLRNWEASVPPDAPNRFVINIQPDQREPIAALLREHGVAAAMKPMVRGRLVAVNGRAVSLNDYTEERAQRLVEREFNLSWDTELPYGNKVVSGRWHADSPDSQFSVEEGLAKTLGLKLGDVLRFEIAGKPVESRITSLRALRWDSMRVNFFVISPPQTLQNFPASYLTAIHVPPDQARLPDTLVARFPNLTVIDVSALLSQFKQVLDQLARAVESVFVFSIAAGVMVLLAALAATQDARRFEVAVLRTLGARGGVLRGALVVECLVLGGLAGVLGVIGASAIGWGLATFLFKLAYTPDWAVLGASIAAAAVGVAVAGLIGTRQARRAAVLEAFRATQ